MRDGQQTGHGVAHQLAGASVAEGTAQGNHAHVQHDDVQTHVVDGFFFTQNAGEHQHAGAHGGDDPGRQTEGLENQADDHNGEHGVAQNFLHGAQRLALSALAAFGGLDGHNGLIGGKLGGKEDGPDQNEEDHRHLDAHLGEHGEGVIGDTVLGQVAVVLNEAGGVWTDGGDGEGTGNRHQADGVHHLGGADVHLFAHADHQRADQSEQGGDAGDELAQREGNQHITGQHLGEGAFGDLVHHLGQVMHHLGAVQAGGDDEHRNHGDNGVAADVAQGGFGIHTAADDQHQHTDH